MPLKTVIVGNADAVRAASAQAHAWTGVEVIGAALIGAGDTDLQLLTRAPVWEAIDVAALGAQAVVLAEPPADGATARAILERTAGARMKLMLVEGGALRRVRLDDLLGRPLGAVDWARIRAMIEGKRVLITGGGGSIGGELARTIAKLAPASLKLLDSSEFNLYRIQRDLPEARIALANVRDAHAVHRWVSEARPDIVFHTAALKQVPIVETFPSEGVLTNIVGLRNVAEAAHGAGADLIFVSTDKAVDPSGVMGASKRLGEIYCQALDRAGGRRAIPVRLGNVLGSTGSVSPIFEEQLAAGGPLTVTDPAVTRFFLTIPQAANALLQAAAVGLANPDQRGVAFVIEMGEAMPVVELAREVIRLEGLRPGEDIAITFTGLRPGEKLHEALIASNEWREADLAPGAIKVASAPHGLADVRERIERLALLARQGADEAVREALFAAIAAQGANDSDERAAG
jgi:O-antigen biosynthesis protein WbqV